VDILPAPASILDGVLRLDVRRTDVTRVDLHGVRLSPAFALLGHVAFQPMGRGRAFCSGDIPVPAAEVPLVVAATERGGLELQTAHERTRDLASGGLRAPERALRPAMWLVRWSGAGDALGLARACRAVLEAASIALPQAAPAPTGGRLDARRLGRILHGYDTAGGPDGVVTALVARRHAVELDGVRVRPQTNLATTVAFQPVGDTGAAAVDFSMAPAEVNAVMRAMRSQGWRLGGVHDRHPGERPRLFSSYQFKTGDPYGLAAEIRRGLDETDSA
jgi:hypothetical protein